MRSVFFCLFTFAFLVSASCRPAAPPVSVSNRPVSINDRPTTNLPLPPAKPLDDMSWTIDAGDTKTLKDQRGKAVILDFWATYCPPCKEEIPHLNSLLAKYGADELTVVGLNVGGDEDRPRIAGFVSETRMSYPFGFPDDDLSRYIFAERDDIPQTAVFDRSGRLVAKIVGFGPQLQKDLDAAVEQAIATQ